MALKWAALLILGASLLSGSATSDGQERPERSAFPQEISISPRILDTYLKPPPQQKSPLIPQQFPATPAPLPFMQRIARWFLTSDPPANQRPFYNAPKHPQVAPQKVPPQLPVKEDCRPCNKIPWIPMFPIKEAITDAVLSLVTGHNSGGGGDAIRPKDPPAQVPYASGPPVQGPYPSGPSVQASYPSGPPAQPSYPSRPPVQGPYPSRPPVQVSSAPPVHRPTIAPPKYPQHTQAHFVSSSLPPRPVQLAKYPPLPPPPPPPYTGPLPFGDHKPLVSYLSPPFNRPSVYGQMRPYHPFGYFPQKEEIHVTIHENKNKPNAIYSIPGGPQIHLKTEPSAGGAQPPKVHAEVIPSVPIADYLSSIEYPMVYGPSHMMDLTNETPRKPVEGVNHGGAELPIHYGQPHKDAGIIGPLPQHSNASEQPPSGYENAHQGGPTGGFNIPEFSPSGPQHSSDPQYSSPAPPHSSPGYSSPAPPLSTASPKIYTSTHSPIDNPTIGSTIGVISTERSSTVSPYSPAVDSTTRASIISSTYSIPVGSSTEGPKFVNSFSPPTSTYVDIQPSLQTAEYLSSLPHNAFRVHPGQGFRLSDGFPFNANLGLPFHTPQKQTHSDVKGHFITKHPHSPTQSPYPRPSPAPFQPPKGEQIHHPVSLAPNPSLWTKDHPYSFEIPPADHSNNKDALSTGSGQTQVPSKDHHFLEEPPIYSFIHNQNGGHFSNQQDKWRYETGAGNQENGPSTIRPVSSSPYYGHPPTPFTTSTTSAPPVLIPNAAYSASTASPNYSGDYNDQSKSKKKTKQVQIIIPYIVGGQRGDALKDADEGQNNGFFNWHQREEDYHDHQESRTVTASALHPNHLTNNNTKLEVEEEGKYQHILAPDIKNLLQTEVDNTASENPLLRLQKNIDAWTVEQFSKKPNSLTNEQGLTTKSVRMLEDHEVSGSHEYSERVRLETTTTVKPRSTSESTASTFWGIQSNLVIPESKRNESGEGVRGVKGIETTSTTANWSKTQVAISPTTKEKVYVVTPMTWDETTTESAAKLQTTPRGVTLSPSSNTFTSPRFLIRPTPGGKTETWPSNGIFVSTTTDASVRENSPDVSSNDIFLPSERARHKASEGSFFGGLETSAVPTPSYTLLPGTQVKTFTGHSRVVTSVSAPTYSYSHGKSTQAPPASSAEDAGTSSGRRVDAEFEGISEDSSLPDAEGVVVELGGDPS